MSCTTLPEWDQQDEIENKPYFCFQHLLLGFLSVYTSCQNICTLLPCEEKNNAPDRDQQDEIENKPYFCFQHLLLGFSEYTSSCPEYALLSCEKNNMLGKEPTS